MAEGQSSSARTDGTTTDQLVIALFLRRRWIPVGCPVCFFAATGIDPQAYCEIIVKAMIQLSFVASAKFIPFSPPLIEEDDILRWSIPSSQTGITTGPKTHEFERKFCEAFNCPAALAVSSCTAALHLALVIVGVGSGDEVITVSHTFCSTVNVIEHTGATPVLIDVEPDTLNMDPSKLRAADYIKDKGPLFLFTTQVILQS